MQTIKNFLKICLKPVGHTMYIYGGGWDETDTKAGKEACTIGESAVWEKFFTTQSDNYDYRNFKNCSSLGLDCTGYIGWAIYNLFNTKCGKDSYVFHSGELGEKLSDKGLGYITNSAEVNDYHCGDILYSKIHKHAFVCVGECSDKSIVIMHSSPPGVMVSGTASPIYSGKSTAQDIANDFMKKFFPDWYNKFPNTSRGKDYLSDYCRFRFFNVLVCDSDNLIGEDPEHILCSLI